MTWQKAFFIYSNNIEHYVILILLLFTGTVEPVVSFVANNLHRYLVNDDDSLGLAYMYAFRVKCT